MGGTNYFVTLQGERVETFRSPDDADPSLRALVLSTPIGAGDASLEMIRSFINTRISSAMVAKIRKLVIDFFVTGMDKVDFKSGWRRLDEGTDEHFSTQAVYVVLSTIRDEHLIDKGQVDPDALLDIMVVISYFRTPTEDSGHLTVLGFRYQHPNPPGSSMYVPAGNPSHSYFDLLRRYLSVQAGWAYLSVQMQMFYQSLPTDGTGVYYTMLVMVNRITMGFNGSPFASDIVTLASVSYLRLESSAGIREALKLDAYILERQSLATLGTQDRTNPQFFGFSPTAAISGGRRLSLPRGPVAVTLAQVVSVVASIPIPAIIPAFIPVPAIVPTLTLVPTLATVVPEPTIPNPPFVPTLTSSFAPTLNPLPMYWSNTSPAPWGNNNGSLGQSNSNDFRAPGLSSAIPGSTMLAGAQTLAGAAAVATAMTDIDASIPGPPTLSGAGGAGGFSEAGGAAAEDTILTEGDTAALMEYLPDLLG